MVAPVVVAAAAPKMVDSATSNDGLINQAFKLTVLIGFFLIIGIAIFLVYKLVGSANVISDLWALLTGDVVAASEDSSLGIFGLGATLAISATPWGRGFNALRRLNRLGKI
jgi:hypothetical protein